MDVALPGVTQVTISTFVVVMSRWADGGAEIPADFLWAQNTSTAASHA